MIWEVGGAFGFGKSLRSSIPITHPPWDPAIGCLARVQGSRTHAEKRWLGDVGSNSRRNWHIVCTNTFDMQVSLPTVREAHILES